MDNHADNPPLDSPLEQRLARLARPEPDPARAEAAIHRVREQLPALAQRPEANPVPQPQAHHRWRTIGLPVGLVALIAIAASIAFLPPRYAPVQQASAADRLKQVIEQNQAYEGWVFQTWVDSEEIGSCYHTQTGAYRMRYRMTGDAADPSYDWYYTVGDDIESNRLTLYHSESNTVVYSLPGSGPDRWDPGLPLPTELRDSIARAMPQIEQGFVGVEEDVAESGEQIFRTLYYMLEYDDAGKPVGRTDEVNNIIEVWADPDTGRIVRQRSLTPEREVRSDSDCLLYYGEEAEAAFERFAAPADATVIDGRPNTETLALYDTLRLRVAQGLGPGVWAVVKLGTIHAEGYDGPRASGKLDLFSSSGESAVRLGFDFAQDASQMDEPGFLALTLAGFLDTPDRLMDLIGGRVPGLCWRTDGESSWNYVYNAPNVTDAGFDYPHWESHIDYPIPLTQNHLAYHTAAGIAWCGWYQPYIHNQGTSVSLVRDGERPGLIGLRTIERDPDLWVSSQKTWWMDPERNHVLVEIEKVHYASRPYTDTPLDVSTVQRTRYLDHAQNAAGLWYPTRWYVETWMRDAAEGDEPGLEEELKLWIEGRGWLLHYPDAELDPMWFGDPRETVNGWLAERDAHRAGEAQGERGE
ncbi:MAG: hypothetical protein ACIAXF_05105 [Phycisphaerales bacterium JB063]